MCKVCFENVAIKLPKVAADKRHSLLMSATCYGLGSIEDVDKQLDELARETDGTYEACVCFANRKMDEDIRKYCSSHIKLDTSLPHTAANLSIMRVDKGAQSIFAISQPTFDKMLSRPDVDWSGHFASIVKKEVGATP